MGTIRELVDAVVAEVYGYTQTIETNSYLTAPVSAADTEFLLADASNFSRGIVQVGDELVLVDLVDRGGNKLTCGTVSSRGLRGTTAASHAAGERVLMSPVVPRAQALSAVKEILRSSGGLFVVATHTFTASAAQRGYDLPAGVDDILSVSWQQPGPGQNWTKVRRWAHDRHNGQLVLSGSVLPGRTVRAVYSAPPTIPGVDDDFTDTGLPESCLDVVKLGAAWKVTSHLEPFTLMPNTAEADAMGRGKSPGTRISVARYLYQLYQVRLQEEVTALQNAHPITVHWSQS